jgi:hypothetical protein
MTGGGELGRDTDAEVMEMLSTCSLNGVPGAFKEVTLGLREETLLVGAAADVNAAGTAGVELLVAPVLGTSGGVSALGVPVMRKVRGCVPERRTGDPANTAAGVLGREDIEDVKEDARVRLATESGIAGAGDPVVDGMSFAVSGVALEMSSFPGCGLLLLISILPFVESASGSCTFVVSGPVLCLFPPS